MLRITLLIFSTLGLAALGWAGQIHYAAKSGSVDQVKRLIAEGAEVDEKDDKGATPLIIAAYSGQREVAAFLISQGADIHAKDSKDTRALHASAIGGHKDVAELLLAEGVDVDATDAEGSTPLGWAAYFGYRDVAVLLLSRGADVNARDNRGSTPLHAATTQVKPSPGTAPGDHSALAKLLIARGADVNARDPNGGTPLMWAAFFGKTRVAEYLIANGADVGAKDRTGAGPLHVAVDRGHKRMAFLLVTHGAGIYEKDARGVTPFEDAGDWADQLKSPPPPPKAAKPKTTAGAVTRGTPADYDVLLPDGAPHVTGSIRVEDLLGDGSPQIFVTEPLRGEVRWIRGPDDVVTLKEGLTQPVRTQVVDLDGDSKLDLLVADIGVLAPTNAKVGRVVLLRNKGDFEFEPLVLLKDVRRVVSAEAADLDGDGDLDIAVSIFGHIHGKTVWLEQREGFTFEEHVLDARAGAIHAFPFDADNDGDLDIAVCLSQDSEEILLFRNDGGGGFAKEVLFDSAAEHYGMSGLEPADLDQDSDIDVLFTNGDTLDLEFPKELDPYEVHGLSWLENDGEGSFTHHEVVRLWGAYAVRALDFDGDSDLDLAVSTVQTTELFPASVTKELVWLVNDGKQNFTELLVEREAPPLMIAIEVVDMDQDGVPEILGGTHDPGRGKVGHRLVLIPPPLEEARRQKARESRIK